MERKISSIMKNIVWILIAFAALAACSSGKKVKKTNEKMADIAGTWYQNGDSNVVCYIVQNQESLVFLSGKETSTGNFKSSYEVFAKDWNANAILSSDHKTLKWPDRTWIKGSFKYPNISGSWFENGEASKHITITQKETKLVMDNGAQKLNAYFYTTNGIYSLENNNYGTYSPLNNTISWGNKVWMRTGK
jgi:hypothetical protein